MTPQPTKITRSPHAQNIRKKPDPKKPAPSNIPKKTFQAKETSTTRMTTAKMMPAKFIIGSAGPDPGVGIKPGSVMEATRMKSGRREER